MGLRAIVVCCPNCNANLEIASTVASVTCAYCGTVSRIQARTTVFQIPKPMSRTQPQLPQLPVARQRFSVLLALLPTLIIAGLVTGGTFFAKRGIPGLISSRVLWAGQVPVLIDVDGDGVADPIGLVHYVMSNDRAHLAAYSGKTGAPLWESESLGSYSELGQLQFAAMGSLVLIASDQGTLTARDVRAKGTVTWQLPMGEKIDAMCAGAAGEAVVGTADDKWFAVDTKGGKRDTRKLVRLDRDYTHDTAREMFDRVGVEAGDAGVCVPLGNTWRQPPGLLALPQWHDLANIPGMAVELLVRHPGGPTVAIGNKRPGTAVPMLARLAPPPPHPAQDPRKRRSSSDKVDLPGAGWVTEVPSIDPLNSRFDAAHFAMTDKAAIALYQGSNASYRLASFDLETGKRLWDRPIHTGTGFTPVCLVVTGDVVMLSTWQNLTAFALADGADRFAIGSSS